MWAGTAAWQRVLMESQYPWRGLMTWSCYAGVSALSDRLVPSSSDCAMAGPTSRWLKRAWLNSIAQHHPATLQTASDRHYRGRCEGDAGPLGPVRLTDQGKEVETVKATLQARWPAEFGYLRIAPPSG